MLSLRPYQTECVLNVKRAFRDHRAVLFQCATGGGKTEMGLQIAADASRRGYQVIWLTHKIELVDQTVARSQASGIPVQATYYTRTYHPECLNVQSIGKWPQQPVCIRYGQKYTYRR